MTLFVRDAITDPGQDFVVMRNVSGSTLLRGTPVTLDTVTLDGVRVTSVITSALLSIFVGVAFRDIPDGSYGEFQKNGYCDYARVAGHGANATAIGDLLVMVAAQTYLQRSGAASGVIGQIIALEVVGIGAAVSARKVWLGPGC